MTIITGAFETAYLGEEPFDVIVAQDVLEHSRDPRRFIETASRALSPGGTLIIRGPLEYQFKATLYQFLRRLPGRKRRIVHQPPFHLQGFVPRSFSHLISSAGLSLEYFHAAADRPTVSFRGVKPLAASLVERCAFYVDQVRGGGDFMTAKAVWRG